MSAFLCHLTVTGQSWMRIMIRYLLKMYFCLASQNRRGLWAAIKVSNEVNAVWDGRILSVTTLFEDECFHSGETQVVRGAKLFLFPPCAMNKLWSYPQSKRSVGGTTDNIGRLKVISPGRTNLHHFTKAVCKFLRPRLLGSWSPSNKCSCAQSSQSCEPISYWEFFCFVLFRFFFFLTREISETDRNLRLHLT